MSKESLLWETAEGPRESIRLDFRKREAFSPNRVRRRLSGGNLVGVEGFWSYPSESLQQFEVGTWLDEVRVGKQDIFGLVNEFDVQSWPKALAVDFPHLVSETATAEPQKRLANSTVTFTYTTTLTTGASMLVGLAAVSLIYFITGVVVLHPVASIILFIPALTFTAMGWVMRNEVKTSLKGRAAVAVENVG